MKRINELIVVEGRHDSEKLKKYFDCETIETGGTSLDEEVLQLIEEVSKRRGVIVFTDPDSPGNRIRNQINGRIPGCLNAFVDREEAKTSKKVGVEHASKETLEKALSHLITYDEHPVEQVTIRDMYDLGLLGSDDSSQKRTKAGKLLHIGNGNAKTMRRRLNCLGITKEELKKVLDQ